MAHLPKKPNLKYPREHARARSISRHLADRGNVIYKHDVESGYEIREVSQDPVVAMVEIRWLAAILAVFTGRPSRDQRQDDQAERLRKIWNDLAEEGYFVAWGWTSNGMVDTSRIMVSGNPIETGYTSTIAPHSPKPLAGAEGPEEPVEAPQDPEPAPEPESLTQEALEESVANLLLDCGKRPFTESNAGFQIYPWYGAQTALILSYARAAADEGEPVSDEEQAAATAASGHYYTALHAHHPTWLLSQEGDSDEVLVVGSTWQHVLMVVVELKRQAWERERPPQADPAQGGQHSLEAWATIADMFISPEQVAKAVAGIELSVELAQDAGASGMERRLHTQVLHAIAAGSPYAVTLAELAMKTNHLYFHRA